MQTSKIKIFKKVSLFLAKYFPEKKVISNGFYTYFKQMKAIQPLEF